MGKVESVNSRFAPGHRNAAPGDEAAFSQRYEISEGYLRTYLAYLAAGEKKAKPFVYNDLEGYKRMLGGLDAFCGYVRTQTTSRHLLDIGAGNAVGINELAASPLGRDLRVTATGLVAPYTSDEQPEKVPYIVTSGEFLDGVQGPIGGITALYSITYSPAPLLVVEAIDAVLEPGGVLKAGLYPLRWPNPRDLDRMSLLPAFDEYFSDMGYDTASHDAISSTIFVAKKPGGSSSLTAKELLTVDLEAQRK